MKRIIQIRGANATGKTTIVRQFIDRHDLKMAWKDINGVKTPFYVSDDKKIVILGRYDRKTGGCDLFKGKTQIVSSIMYAVKELKAETIIFEGFIYGKSFTFAHDLNSLAKIIGYKFIGIVLTRSFENIVRLLTIRNGGSYFSMDNLQRTYIDVENSYKKLKAAGITVKKKNTDEVREEDMYTILESEL